jgi:hypothetical protein
VDTAPVAKELFSFSENNSESLSIDRGEKQIPKRDFINRINYANFEKIPLTLVFRHKTFGRTISVPAFAEPCVSDDLSLRWMDDRAAEENLDSFNLEYITIPGFDRTLRFFPLNCLIYSDGISVSLPENAYELQQRETVRETCRFIDVTIIQNGTLFRGKLINFHSSGFLVHLDRKQTGSIKLLNREEQVSLLIQKGENMIFSGICSVGSSRDNRGNRELVLQPVSTGFKRFRGKEYRGERYDMSSSIQIDFTHPLSGMDKKLKVKDLSGSGFSVFESADKPVLFAGLLIPELKITLPGHNSLHCRVQVIYSGREFEEDSGQVLAGLAILDMNPREYTRLLDYIHHEIDNRSNISHEVDTHALWRFFFESGFIYPEKYRYLLEDIDRIKELYNKLYTEEPAIARHFIYQKDNHIQGHMSMLRSYEKSWLLHHHAASSINGENSGLHVLNQVGSFTNNCTHIESMHLDYLFCYFRRENKFPNRMFGGLAEKINDNSKCSLDDWAYFHFERRDAGDFFNTSSWKLEPATEGDLRDLQSFYGQREGGLMLKNFNLEDGMMESDSLLEDYNESGFSRHISFYSLRKNGPASALIMVDKTDAGLNMSDLTNSLKIFIIDSKELDETVLHKALAALSSEYSGQERVSALAYPLDSVRQLNLSVDKIYTLWVLNLEAGDSYFHHLKKLIRKIHY